jgi:predicted outer membrane repeat protein
MQRFIRMSLLMVLIGLFSTGALWAKPQAYVSGTLNSDEVRVFLKDSTYVIDRDYMVSGTLIVEPGTEVLFYPNGRVVVREGGRLIADGDARAEYKEGVNPLSTSNGYTGYADPAYFLGLESGDDFIDVQTAEEMTVNREKENHIFNVIYDIENRTLRGLPNPDAAPAFSARDTVANVDGVELSNTEYIISYEHAMMLTASHINEVEVGRNDDLLNINPWKRIHVRNADDDVNIEAATINFKGQPALNSSREWGHIVVLPGARAAYFRNCKFDNFRKEITVDRADFYDNDENGNFENYEDVNETLKKMTNGSGGALTTLSSRTWLLDCTFENNMARLRGGAVQFLEAPKGYPVDVEINEYYDLDKNPAVVNRDGSASEIIYNETHKRSNIKKIDCIDEEGNEPLNCMARRAYDDARLAIYLGRVRNLTFDNNYTLISNTKLTAQGVVDDKEEIADVIDTEIANKELRHLSAGGAMFISSSRRQAFGYPANDIYDKGSYMEFALGCNNVIKMDGEEVSLYSGNDFDNITVTNNYSENYSTKGEGSMGGAIYLAYGTSMIFSGQLENNSVKSKFTTAGDKARGGAIFVDNSEGSRLQFRGGSAKSDAGFNTNIAGNTARLGGAVYVDGYSANIPGSPIIGGHDVLISTRNWGFDIVFENNEAEMDGGAIYTKRQMVVNGAGGVEGNSMLGYGGNYSVKFYNNKAGFSGGAIKSFIPPFSNGKEMPDNKKLTQLVRAEFKGNEVGIPAMKEGKYDHDVERVAGGGAFYGVYTELDEVKACLFENNTVLNGNGAAIALIQIDDYIRHAFCTDLDKVNRNSEGLVESITSENKVFTHYDADVNYVADTRMMTRFINNVASVDAEVKDKFMGAGSGATQISQKDDVVRYNPDITELNGLNGGLPENGVGLGGAIYVADDLNWMETKTDINVENDELFYMNRVRMIGNEAYTGSAVYSDAYNVTFVLSRSLVTKNVATSLVGDGQNVINGPLTATDNPASSDLAPATFYAEVQGPIPASSYSEAANSLYDNTARFLIRLPDAPNTKGLLAGATPGIGHGGTNVIKGNYWGETQANVIMDVDAWNRGGQTTTKMETFFIKGSETQSYLPFIYYPMAKEYSNDADKTELDFANDFTADARTQGPFESIESYMYKPVPLNDDLTKSIPEELLFSGKIYDLYDKGTDIKTADYSNRRMSPIEDFAVGVPPRLNKFGADKGPYEGNYVIKWTRDPAVAEATDANGNLLYPGINALQRVYFAPDSNYVDNHPMGYPLYLEANIDYSDDEVYSNHNDMFLNESVFFVINEANNDFIRVNLKQVSEEAPYREVFRNTVELVPDMAITTYGAQDKNRYINRRLKEGLKTLGSGADMLRALTVFGKDNYENAYDEDFATLKGRKYDAKERNDGELGYDANLSGVISNLFSNENMPVSNEGQATYFAGERYRSLPVKVGDTIRVISRTELWRIKDESGIDAVMKGGLKFVVAPSTMKPEFTGEVVDLKNQIDTLIKRSDKPWKDYDTIVVDEFKNRKFFEEDTEYENILSVTAVDTVDMYNPISVWAPADVSELEYNWSVDSKDGVSYWLNKVDLNADEYKDGANGYLRIEGQPINPFVVPGGEKVSVTVKNWSPTKELINELDANRTNYTNIDDDVVSKYIEIFPEYFNGSVYDEDNARYLQQDTINVGRDNTASYEFEVFVVNTPPKFIDYSYDYYVNRDSLTRTIGGTEVNDWVVYNPTYYPHWTYKADKANNGIIEKYYEDANGNIVEDITSLEEIVLTDEQYLYADTDIFSNVINPTSLNPITIDRKTINGYYLDNPEDPDYSAKVLIANVTDKLRFSLDINTRDEMEDYSKAAQGWDFKYGKSSYGFMNITDYEKATDSTMFEGLKETRPNWMANEYFVPMVGGSNVDALADFTLRGKINIEIDSAEAFKLLNPFTDEDNNGTGYMTNDTVFTVVANDGHSGVNTEQYQVTINYSPEILTETLPAASQDVQYNNGLNNFAKIEVFDKNFDQKHKYVLLYNDTAKAGITEVLPYDPINPEAGERKITDADRTTPSWLKINAESGILYGMPKAEDFGPLEWAIATIDDGNGGTIERLVPRPQEVTASVLVFDVVGKTNVHFRDPAADITDPMDVEQLDLEMLHDMKQIKFNVFPRAYNPEITMNVPTICVIKGGDFEHKFTVRDKDFTREGDQVKVEVVDADGNPVNGVSLDTDIINGNTVSTEEVEITMTGTNFDVPTTDGKVELYIRAYTYLQDQSGNWYKGEVVVFPFTVGVSEDIKFITDITVSNANDEYQVLEFGVDHATNGVRATIGDGTNEDKYAGQLDTDYCEYELPPTPPTDVFDARWKIPLRNGTLRNIHPYYTEEDAEKGLFKSIYECDYQGGGVHSDASTRYPITITWNTKKITDWEEDGNKGTWVIRDRKSNGQIFMADMKYPDAGGSSSYAYYTSNIEGNRIDDETFAITINRTDIDGFIIEYLYSGVSVEEEGITNTEIVSVSPNPMTTESSIKFSVVEPTALTIDVIDNLGRVVTTIENNSFFANGVHTIEWNGRNSDNEQMVSGQYMIRLNANGKVSTYPVVIVK